MRRIQIAEGEYYHLYNRGVDKRKVFTNPQEYRRFLAYLYLMNDSATTRLTYDLHQFNIDEAKPRQPEGRLVALGAYCLMPNHFHLYVTPLCEDGISRFMQRVQTAYTMYFNQKHGRSGALFEGTFKARHIDSDRYARYLYSYIHLNPAKLKDKNWKELGTKDIKGLREYVRSYPYSSVREYSARRHTVTNPSAFPGFLTSAREVDDHITEWLRFRGENMW